jgi:hypothetical protein
MTTYRQYERLPATNYARQFRSLHNQLEQEVHGEHANDDQEKPAGFHPAVLIFLVMSGCAFWGEVAVLILKSLH